MRSLSVNASPEAAQRSLKIMLVEADSISSDILRQTLEQRKHAVIPCSSAEQALGYLQEGARPDLIVLELLLTGMDGWQFRVEQKRNAQWAAIPVIVVSRDLSAKAEAVDAAAYFRKPVDTHLLLEGVERIGRDIEVQRLLAESADLERLISLGSLVGGIAHEINNPLTFIGGSLDLLRRQLLSIVNPASATAPFSVEAALQAVEQAHVGAQRIGAVVKCVSLFTAAGADNDETIDVHAVLESSLQVAATEIRHCAKLERVYLDVPRVRGSGAKLAQVFLNILINAVHAIRTSREREREHVISVATSVDAESNVVVSIRDSATVVCPELKMNMFNPLTTAQTGRMGLQFGLAISREVIESMGGSISVQKTHPSGALFRIALPSTTRMSYPAPAYVSEVMPRHHRPVVLVVDDEPLVCELLSDALSSDYEVVSFTSPQAALSSILEGHFDAVLCDVMMPGLDGVDLYQRAALERPDMLLRFIFVTGGAFTARAQDFLRRTGRPTLQKPFRRSEVRAAVASLLQSSASVTN